MSADDLQKLSDLLLAFSNEEASPYQGHRQPDSNL